MREPRWVDLCTDAAVSTVDDTLQIALGPYDTAWLRLSSELDRSQARR